MPLARCMSAGPGFVFSGGRASSDRSTEMQLGTLEFLQGVQNPSF